MAKIILGKRPKNFKKTITVTMLEGGEGSVEMSYKYRTRTEFGTFIDELFNDAGVKPASQDDADVKFSLAEALKKTLDVNADYIMKVADGWNLDIEFSRDSVAQLCDELPGVALQIIDSYRLAITEGRLGN
ncbi:phage tail assembly chaperone [Undibacterium baiyunense]|uniref:Tail assembly chaperone n=1 Tax=Undibacterium baiyunense TaxID=2828731 RepID=A0A941DG18_9BURK|nr:phage tail assembly chaperone [Undibacterium baiyunense]MBR7747460.1 hypothetical protein [Undibacterium baiyunense]